MSAEDFAPPARRILSVDLLRGLVMIIMALDHTRDFFTNFRHDPTDLQYASTFMFLTRWITHFCAPVFVFLSGTSAFLSLQGGKTKGRAARLLLTRGLWLILLELTIIRFGWMFNWDYSLAIVQVIWAIGWSMICLAGLIFLPRALITGFGLLLVFGHNALDGIRAEQFGDHRIWWHLVHQQGFVPVGHGVVFAVIYPLIPWIGVMALGYVFGSLLQAPPRIRDRWLYGIGSSAILLFLALRILNVYGEPVPWLPQGTWHRNVLSVLNCTKYPPSLCYLLMTLGPAILAMPLLERMRGRFAGFIGVYGRVPLFYYILHIYLLHTMAIVTGVALGFPAGYFTGNQNIFSPDGKWGFGLPVIYAFWAAAILLLYLPCVWFMRVKATHRKWWLSYL